MVCTVKQLFSLWADPLVMEYFRSAKFRVLSDCSYCAEPTSHKPVLHKGPLCQGYQKCVKKNTHHFGTVCSCTKSEATRCWKKPKPRWHILSTNSRTHSLPWNISGNQKQALPLSSDTFHMEINAQLLKSLGFAVSWWRLSSVGFFCLP